MTTPGSTSSAPDPETVRRLVAEVIRRIATVAPSAAASPAPAAATDVAPPSPADGILLTDRVITLAVIDKLPPGTRQAAHPAEAVITPSARDRARETGVTLVRMPAARALPGAAVMARPFLMAHASCTPAPVATMATIARSVPGSQQLPASGLVDVVASLAEHVVRGGGRGILLTNRPAVAIVLANRRTGLRAVGGPDMRAVLAAAAECAANLLVVDPVFPGGLERLCVEFAGRPDMPAPAELASGGGPAGCGCTHGGPR